MNTEISKWGFLKPLERVDLEGAPFESRLETVPLPYSLVATVRQEGSYILSPLAGRAGFLPRECDMDGLVDPSLWTSGEVSLSLDQPTSTLNKINASIPVDALIA